MTAAKKKMVNFCGKQGAFCHCIQLIKNLSDIALCRLSLWSLFVTAVIKSSLFVIRHRYCCSCGDYSGCYCRDCWDQIMKLFIKDQTYPNFFFITSAQVIVFATASPSPSHKTWRDGPLDNFFSAYWERDVHRIFTSAHRYCDKWLSLQNIKVLI